MLTLGTHNVTPHTTEGEHHTARSHLALGARRTLSYAPIAFNQRASQDQLAIFLTSATLVLVKENDHPSGGRKRTLAAPSQRRRLEATVSGGLQPGDAVCWGGWIQSETFPIAGLSTLTFGCFA